MKKALYSELLQFVEMELLGSLPDMLGEKVYYVQTDQQNQRIRA